MSRIFRAPLSEGGEDTVIYVNFGWLNKSGMSFPAYNPVVMTQWMPEEKYEQMCAEIRQYMDEKAGCSSTVWGLLLVLSCLLLVPLICVIPIYCSKKNQMVKDVQDIIQKYSPNSTLFNLETQGRRIKGNDPNLMGIDSDGERCIQTWTRQMNSGGYYGPIWPPSGCSIVYQLPGRAVADCFQDGAPAEAAVGTTAQQIVVAVNPVHTTPAVTSIAQVAPAPEPVATATTL